MNVFGTRQGGHHYCDRIISHFKFYFFREKIVTFYKVSVVHKVLLYHVASYLSPFHSELEIVRSIRNQLKSDNYCNCKEHVPHDLNTVLCLISLSSHYKAN